LTGSLLLGCAKVDITPDFPIPLAGFAHRTGSFEQVDQKLFVRVFLFQQNFSDGSYERALLFSGDLLWWPEPRMKEWKRSLQERMGIKPEMVTFSATHTHSGPQTSGQFIGSLGSENKQYMSKLEQLVFAGVETAASDMEPVSISQGKGACGFAVNRRKKIDGRIEMAPNEQGPVDREVCVISFDRETSKDTKAVWMHYACHPTTTDANRISSEFAGTAAELVEAHYQDGTTVAFLQGCSGDVRPALIRDDRFFRGDNSHVHHFGSMLADEVIRILKGNKQKISSGSLSGKTVRVELPFERIPDLEALELASKQSGIVGEWGAFMKNDPTRLKPFAELECSLISFSSHLSLLSMNAEMVGEYGRYIKSISEGCTLPIAYSNGMIGYVPTALQLEEGGYEADESTYYFAMPSIFSKEIERKIKDSFDQLINHS
jgi:hypothetical protein